MAYIGINNRIVAKNKTMAFRHVLGKELRHSEPIFLTRKNKVLSLPLSYVARLCTAFRPQRKRLGSRASSPIASISTTKVSIFVFLFLFSLDALRLPVVFFWSFTDHMKVRIGRGGGGGYSKPLKLKL